jgi:hypothetical protein
MPTAGDSAISTVLPDGEVLVVGTDNNELYDPATGTWAVTGSMIVSRIGETLILLPDGKVLAAGGGPSAGSGVLSSAELYNPATAKWARTGSMNTARAGQTANLLNNGDVLVTSGTLTSFSELYHPATGQWSASGGAGGCSSGDGCLNSTATLLGDGDVLVAGGLIGSPSNPRTTAGAILYDPATNAWTTTGSMTTPRELQTANLLTDGQVLVFGGEDFANHRVTRLASAELYTP